MQAACDPATLRAPSWLECLQCGDENCPPSTALMTLFDEVQALLWSGQFRRLDQLLGLVQPELMSVGTMVAVLRYSFGGRDKLERWDSLVSDIEEELIRRGRNTEVILRGLYRHKETAL